MYSSDDAGCTAVCDWERNTATAHNVVLQLLFGDVIRVVAVVEAPGVICHTWSSVFIIIFPR